MQPPIFVGSSAGHAQEQPFVVLKCTVPPELSAAAVGFGAKVDTVDGTEAEAEDVVGADADPDAETETDPDVEY